MLPQGGKIANTAFQCPNTAEWFSITTQEFNIFGGWIQVQCCYCDCYDVAALDGSDMSNPQVHCYDLKGK
jgi:hypothetical protein